MQPCSLCFSCRSDAARRNALWSALAATTFASVLWSVTAHSDVQAQAQAHISNGRSVSASTTVNNAAHIAIHGRQVSSIGRDALPARTILSSHRKPESTSVPSSTSSFAKWVPCGVAAFTFGILCFLLRCWRKQQPAQQLAMMTASSGELSKVVEEEPMEVYQIRVSLEGAPKPIWRRLLVDSSMELKDLHQVLQISMPWSDRRLHQFVSQEDETCYLPPVTDPSRKRWVGPNDQLYCGVRLNQVLREVRDSISYEYDFLEYWCHEVILEKIVSADRDDVVLPRCVAGERACPPEGSRNPLGDPEESPCWELAAQLSFDPVALDRFLMLWGSNRKPSAPPA